MSCLTIRFRQSRTDDFPWYVELAKRGTYQVHPLTEKQAVHETRFDLLDPIPLGHAISLVKAIMHDKKAEVFADGQTLDFRAVVSLLECYQQSLHAADPQAYCWFATQYTYDLTVTTYTIDLDAAKTLLFPCRCAANRAYGIHPAQPGTIEEQVDAALVRAGTRWCPRLADLTAWREAQAAMRTA